jgi:hypothetical protein
VPILRIAHHRARSVIDLSFFSGGGLNDPYGLWQLGSAKFVNKTLHALVAKGKSVIGNPILPDGHGIPATTQPLLNEFAVRLAGAGDPILVACWR